MADVQDLQSIHIKESIILIFFIMDDEKNNQHYSDDTSWSYIVCVCVLIHCRGVAYCYSTEAGGLGAAISDFEQFRVYLGPVLLQNSQIIMSQLPVYTIVHS